MGQPQKLQELLEGILGTDEVYLQPGENVTMSYPAIVYNVDGLNTKWADNLAYDQIIEWQVVFIARSPDDDTWRKIGRLPRSTLNRTSVVDNLNHYYFTLYF
jgi:hypothetical protein